jgi:hypothetical protein
MGISCYLTFHFLLDEHKIHFSEMDTIIRTNLILTQSNERVLKLQYN